MTGRQASVELPEVLAALTAGLRAPSAHNAQPWRLRRVEARAYLLWYSHADRLRADPDDRDGLMAMGGFYETVHLESHARGLDTTFEPTDVSVPGGTALGIIRFDTLASSPDALASSISGRTCNRHPYRRETPPAVLGAGLADLGNLLLPPDSVAGLVSRASVLSWKDSRFVSDLCDWTRFDDRSRDGMTLQCLRLNRLDQVALRVALRLGRLPSWLAWIYAQRDVRLTRRTGRIAVLTIDRRDRAALFDAGRRLIRSWTLVNSMGYAWHPMSVVIDQSTVDDLRRLIGGRDPVAIYRVGYTAEAAARSFRRTLDEVLDAET